MRAVKLNAYIGANHRLELDLPEDVPAGAAEVIVLVPDEVIGGDDTQRHYLKALFADLDASPGPRMSKEEIDRYIEEERADWGE